MKILVIPIFIIFMAESVTNLCSRISYVQFGNYQTLKTQNEKLLGILLFDGLLLSKILLELLFDDINVSLV